MKKSSLSEFGTIPYWYNHWKWFNKIAKQCKCWKLKYLFHDIEKPFLMWLWNDFERVQEWHVTHNSHHPQNKPFEKLDVVGMLIDWEASYRSKSFAKQSAREFFNDKYKSGKSKRFNAEQLKIIEDTLDWLRL